MGKREYLFKDYVSSCFGRVNRFDPEEYEHGVKGYEFNFGRFLPTDKDAPILDVGCGAGHFLYYLKKKGYTNFKGIDISPSQIEVCKKKCDWQSGNSRCYGISC